jgi:hypothetical protein
LSIVVIFPIVPGDYRFTGIIRKLYPVQATFIIHKGRRMLAQSVLIMLVVSMPGLTGGAMAADYVPEYAANANPMAAGYSQMAAGQGPMAECPVYSNDGPFFGSAGWTKTKAEFSSKADWYIDYRTRWMVGSHTSYEFGMPPEFPPAYAPISRLDFCLDSPWHGLQVGMNKPNFSAHFEWLAPQNKNISGELIDTDWMTASDPTRVDSLTHSDLRWYDGQTLEVGGEFKLFDGWLLFPLEFWPTGGFRFQRFNMIASSLYYSVPPYGPYLPLNNVDGITFNQEYYIGYAGGQLRTRLDLGGAVPVDIKLEGDWGSVNGYNVDHHLLREGDRYTMETTYGQSWHIALTAEVPMGKVFSLGLQAEHMEIRTHGTHHFVNAPLGTDMSWDNGVKVTSDQTSLSMFIRAHF